MELTCEGANGEMRAFVLEWGGQRKAGSNGGWVKCGIPVGARGKKT